MKVAQFVLDVLIALAAIVAILFLMASIDDNQARQLEQKPEPVKRQTQAEKEWQALYKWAEQFEPAKIK